MVFFLSFCLVQKDRDFLSGYLFENQECDTGFPHVFLGLCVLGIHSTRNPHGDPGPPKIPIHYARVSVHISGGTVGFLTHQGP